MVKYPAELASITTSHVLTPEAKSFPGKKKNKVAAPFFQQSQHDWVIPTYLMFTRELLGRFGTSVLQPFLDIFKEKNHLFNHR